MPCQQCGSLLVIGAATAAAQGPVLLLAGAAALGIGYGTLLSAGQAFAVSRSPEGRAGVAVGSFFLLVDLGTGLGPAALGAAVPLAGYRGAIGIGAAFGVLATALYVLRVRPRPMA